MNPFLVPYISIYSKWFTDLHVRTNVIVLFKGNTRVNEALDLAVFLDRAQKYVIKVKINKFTFKMKKKLLQRSHKKVKR